MKKVILTLAAACAAMIFAAPAKAQYSGATANNPCNTQFSGGFKNYAQPLTVRFYVNVHYTAADMDAVKKNLATAMVNLMNQQAVAQGSNVRIVATDFDNPVNLNFTIWLDIYHNGSDLDNGYQVFDSVGGWGAGHLFKFYTAVGTTEGVLTEAANGTFGRLADGWTCGSN